MNRPPSQDVTRPDGKLPMSQAESLNGGRVQERFLGVSRSLKSKASQGPGSQSQRKVTRNVLESRGLSSEKWAGPPQRGSSYSPRTPSEDGGCGLWKREGQSLNAIAAVIQHGGGGRALRKLPAHSSSRTAICIEPNMVNSTQIKTECAAVE